MGDGPDHDTPNRQEPGRLNTGITVVGKRACCRAGAAWAGTSRSASGVRSADFASAPVVKSGGTVERKPTGGPRAPVSSPATLGQRPRTRASGPRG